MAHGCFVSICQRAVQRNTYTYSGTHTQTSSSFVHLSNEDIGRELVVTADVPRDVGGSRLSIPFYPSHTYKHTQMPTHVQSQNTQAHLKKCHFHRHLTLVPAVTVTFVCCKIVLCCNCVGTPTYVECGPLVLPLVVTWWCCYCAGSLCPARLQLRSCFQGNSS